MQREAGPSVRPIDGDRSNEILPHHRWSRQIVPLVVPSCGRSIMSLRGAEEAAAGDAKYRRLGAGRGDQAITECVRVRRMC